MKTQKKSFSLYCATLGPIGYLQAPGTMATLATMPLVYCLRLATPDSLYIFIIIAITMGAITVINNALEYFKGYQDPSQIVLDELIGCLITFSIVPIHWYTLIAGFIFFRFFDITKWFGIKYAEQFIGAWGVVLDDICAALLANFCIWLLYYGMAGAL
jgi:phosphatidylglycerophosphatase A